MLRAIYDLAFAYIDGDVNQADASAGTAAGTLLRLLFNHAGSILYKMQAGMGDTVFTPFYLALRERGVKFRFFHTVTRLGLSDDHTTVDEIEVVEQVKLAPGLTEYQPLVVAHEDDPKPWCWPSEPLWAQLQASPDTFPIPLSSLEQNGNPFNTQPTVLKREQGDGDGDFDQVVLGISIGALAPICQELIGSQRGLQDGPGDGQDHAHPGLSAVDAQGHGGIGLDARDQLGGRRLRGADGHLLRHDPLRARRGLALRAPDLSRSPISAGSCRASTGRLRRRRPSGSRTAPEISSPARSPRCGPVG